MGLRVGELLGVVISSEDWVRKGRREELMVSRSVLAMYRMGVSRVSARVRGIA